jgi:hypothetical protein
MMKLTSLLHKDNDYSSELWHSSKIMAGVRFAIKKISLRQRIELNHRVKELTIKYDFLQAGDTLAHLDAALSDLLVAKLYLEWGLKAIQGLSIDGENATVDLLIAKGPEGLTNEIVLLIQAESALTDIERKNS